MGAKQCSRNGIKVSTIKILKIAIDYKINFNFLSNPPIINIQGFPFGNIFKKVDFIFKMHAFSNLNFFQDIRAINFGCYYTEGWNC